MEKYYWFRISSSEVYILGKTSEEMEALVDIFNSYLDRFQLTGPDPIRTDLGLMLRLHVRALNESDSFADNMTHIIASYSLGNSSEPIEPIEPIMDTDEENIPNEYLH